MMNPLPSHYPVFQGKPKASVAAANKGVCYYFGTFDPVHNGHLAVAEAALKQGPYSQLVFVPAFAPPHKRAQQVTSFQARVAMLKLACQNRPDMTVSEIESGLPTPSYTAQTIKALAKNDKREKLPFIIGADALQDLPNWKAARSLLRKLFFVVAPRPPFATPESLKIANKSRIFQHRTLQQKAFLGLSSTQVRNRVGAGHNIQTLVPSSVDAFIRQNRLYQD